MNSLEALKRIERDMEYITRLDFVDPIVRGQVREELYKIYWREEKDLTIIEKELKSFEILKKYISQYKDYLYETDNDFIFLDFRISQEEYNLLKEVLL